MKLEFEWDIQKLKSNYNKHGVSFDEALTVFDDENAAFLEDPDHSIYENRYIIIGYSIYNNLLFISFTERENRIRLISARKATKNERKRHEENCRRW